MDWETWKREDACRRIVWALLVLATASVWGVVFAFGLWILTFPGAQ